MMHQITLEPVTEEIARTRLCPFNAAGQSCAASQCMAWGAVEPNAEERSIPLPATVAAQYNAANAARFALGDEVEPAEDGADIDDSAIMAWIQVAVRDAAGDGWALTDNETPEQALINMWDYGHFDGPLDPCGIVLDLERAIACEQPRGHCIRLTRRY